MRRSFTLVALVVLAACKRPEPPPRPAGNPSASASQVPGSQEPGITPQASATPSAGNAASPQVLRGKVTEKIDVSQYSYLKLATASGEKWTAVPRTDKKVGDEVGVGNVLAMQNYESPELKRKFDVVYFGTLAGPGGDVAPMPPAMGGSSGTSGTQAAAGAEGPMNASDIAAQHQAAIAGRPDVKVPKVAKATGADARTVEEIWSQREKLKGKTVTVRGQVVTFTPAMGKNFLHLRDGTGDPGTKTNDVTVTTGDSAAVGDVVTAKGVVVTDKNLGFGYAYPVIVEDAKVTK